MQDYHTKNLIVNASLTKLISSTGTSVQNDPNFYYKDSMLLRFSIVDNTNTAVDLSGGSFEFKIISSYSTQNELVTSDNSQFISADWADYSEAGGKICCRVDMDQAAILTYIDGESKATGYCGLWATISGVNYLLAQFDANICNIIS